MIGLIFNLFFRGLRICGWVAKNLPESKAVGLRWLTVGLFSLSSLFAFRFFTHLNEFAKVTIFLLAIWGGFGCVFGGMILMRAAILSWQDRRSPEIISMRWK